MTERHVTLRLIEESIEWLTVMREQAMKRWNVDIPQSVIDNIAFDFSLRGKNGGQAYGYMKLRYNLDIIKLNGADAYCKRTVPHECAHIIQKAMANYNRGTERTLDYSSHGYVWKTIMRGAGLESSRCHNYKTAPVRTTRKFLWAMSNGQTVELTSIRHKRQISGEKNYYCNGVKLTEFIKEVK